MLRVVCQACLSVGSEAKSEKCCRRTSPENREKAKRAFNKALTLDPLCIDAALALVDLYVDLADYGTCIELLQHCLQNHNQDFLHTKLADVFTLNEQYSEALTCYHTAISLNPSSTAAAQGLVDEIVGSGLEDAITVGDATSVQLLVTSALR